MEYYIAEKRWGITIAVMSGMGRNKGSWDACTKSKRTAYRWLKQIRAMYPERKFAVESE